MDIIQIAKIVNENGGKLYLVGGSVRDEILGINNHDEDYCVTGISEEEFIKLFPNAYIRGKAFSVFDIDKKEFALARKERKSGVGHKEFDVQTDKSITIEEDLGRRDITINSIAKDVLTGKIIDPYNGIKDIQDKVIRATTIHFKEDPLRVYRVARFASKFNFDVDENTIKLMNELKNELKELSAERVYSEFSKAMLENKPSIFFNNLRKAEVLDVHFKEIYDLINVEQPIKYHPEGDAYNHTMDVLDKVSYITREFDDKRKLEIRFAALVHDIGKGTTPKEKYPHHIGHEIRGEKLVSEFGHRLKIPNNLIKCGKTTCLEHMRGGIFSKMTPSKKVNFIERIGKSQIGLSGLQIIVNCDSNDNCENFEKIGKKCLEEINGEYIKRKYNKDFGKEFKDVLHQERVNWMKKHEKIGKNK